MLKRKTPLSGKLNLKGGGRIKSSSPKSKKMDINLFEADKAFYESLWRVVDHRCTSCGKYLGEEVSPMFLDHLLPKHMYPEFRHEPRNIYVCCMDCHATKESGFPNPKHAQAIEEAKKILLPTP